MKSGGILNPAVNVRTLLASICLVLVSSAASSQGELRKQLKDTMPGARWVYDDWGRAKKFAAKKNKPIFAVFRCVP